MRYRLRLGPFADEDAADSILRMVREVYPGALKATADTDDMRAIATLQAKAASASPVEPAASAPAISVIPASSVVPPGVSPPVLTRERKLPRSSAPFPRQDAHVARQAEQIVERIPTLESTQTVRVLTTSELEDAQAARWLVIELSVAEHAFDPDTVANLDIFSMYRLYSVAGMDQGRIVHALRLGFFGEETAARAVASYLAAFYDKPTIKRVSAEERQRFAQHSIDPRKDVGTTGRQAIIEITSERFVRGVRGG